MRPTGLLNRWRFIYGLARNPLWKKLVFEDCLQQLIFCQKDISCMDRIRFFAEKFHSPLNKWWWLKEEGGALCHLKRELFRYSMWFEMWLSIRDSPRHCLFSTNETNVCKMLSKWSMFCIELDSWLHARCLMPRERSNPCRTTCINIA